uniref:BAG domain-containing protein n=1 Tax=Setaria italica TaxID=4555 RepID=K3ZL35_SETIT
MASRRFFAYDPYDYYYASPYHYTYPYYQNQQPAPPCGAGGFFPDAAPEASSRPVSIPVRFVGSDLEPESGTVRMPPPAATAVPRKRAPSAEEAALRVQAATRGFLARRSVRAVRDVEREAEEVRGKIAREVEALRVDAMARVAVGEALMRMLLRLDAVRGAREYRRKVTKRVLALQDAVDALEATPALVAASDQEIESAVTADESAVASEVTDVVERSGEIEEEAVEAAAEMEVDADGADGEQGEAEERKQALDAENLAGDKPEGSDAEGEWEMVTEEPEPAAEPTTCHEAPQHQESAGTEIRTAAEAGGAGLDTAKVMEMVAALCERNAQQCAVIGALAERVDALERAVRRVEDAERRRRRAKKLRKEGKWSNNGKCYSD